MSQQNLEKSEQWSYQASAKHSKSYTPTLGVRTARVTPLPVRIWPSQLPPPPPQLSALPGMMASLVLFIPERILSTHRDPGCVTSPAPPHTTSCSRPRACSSLWGTEGSDLTDCASPECIQRPRSDQAFPANQGNLASQQHLGDRRRIAISSAHCGHQLALHPVWHCLWQSCTMRSPSYMNY